MKRFLNIMKTILSLLLGIISFVFIVAYTMLNVTENLMSKENIVNAVKNIDIVELIGEDKKQEVYAILEKADIPTEYIDVMLEDEEVKETLGEYIALSFEYVMSNEEIPEIDENEVTEVLITSFDKVIEEAENHEIEVNTYISEEKQEKIHEKIEYYVPEVVEQIPAVEEFIQNQIDQNSTLTEAKENMAKIEQVIDNIQMIYSYKNLLLIGIILPLVLIIFMKYKNFRFIKWIAFPFLMVAALLKLIYMVIPYVLESQMPSEFSKVEPIIEPTIEAFLSGINQTTLLCFIIGMSLVVIQIAISLYIKKERKKK